MPMLSRCKLVVFLIAIPFSISFSKPPDRVMLGSINVNLADTVISVRMTESALAIALEVSGQFAYVPSVVRDSVLKAKGGGETTLLYAAREIDATDIVFVTVQRIVNLVRAEVVFASGNDFSNRKTGIGYAIIEYVKEGSETPIADPTVLTALQRAIASALNNHDLYANADSLIRAYPTELVAVGGIDFNSSKDSLLQWDLFKERTIASYDVAQNIVYDLRHDTAFTVLDIDTRDTMFAMAGFHLVANDRPVTASEIDILRKFQVKGLIVGSFVKTESSARLTLEHAVINENNSYTPIRSASADVPEDAKGALHIAIKKCLKELY